MFLELSLSRNPESGAHTDLVHRSRFTPNLRRLIVVSLREVTVSMRLYFG